MKPTRNIIRDGHTRPGYLLPEDRLHQALEFTYRPMLAEEVEALESTAAAKPSKRDAVVLLAAGMAKQLATWSEVDEEGKGVSIDINAVRHLPNALFNKLYRVIAGLAPGDPPPTATAEELDEYTSQVLAAAKDARPVGQVVQEAASKN